MRKIFKYSWVIIINIIFILYSLELLTTIFLQPKVSKYVDIDYNRYQKARELGIDFDTRTFWQAFFEERINEPTLAPNYYAKSHLVPRHGYDVSIQKFLQSQLKNNGIIPLRGPINKKTLSCNEDGKRRIVNNDKYGFKNPNSIYEKKIRVFLIGDSFAEGECHDENGNISGILRNEYKINSATFGMGSAGPLLSLAALKEYGGHFKPEFVIYLYYEGNDMDDLRTSKNTFLIKYINNFSQNLFNRTEEIENFFIEYENLAYKAFKKHFETDYNKFDEKVMKEIENSKKRKKIEIIKDSFELQKLKNIFHTESFFGFKNTIDKKLFYKVLEQMKLEANSWDGKLIVVYLPDWNRYWQKYSFVKYYHKKNIESVIKSLNLHYIDISKEFEKKKEPMNLYPFGLYGHYTTEGYQLVAKNIYKNIKKN